jgi:hypothetical protein
LFPEKVMMISDLWRVELQGLLKIIKHADMQNARETAVWALAICCCNDEWQVVPQVWELDGCRSLCEILHQKRWKSSSRCVQYAATIIQLTLETMQGHLLRAETNDYVGKQAVPPWRPLLLRLEDTRAKG